MTEAPLLSISVVSHGHRALLLPLLEDIARLGREISLELVLTENIPEDLEDIVRDSGIPYRLIRNGRPHGFGANHNAAFAVSRAPFFAVMNPDLRLPDNQSLLVLVERVKAAPGVAGPRVLAPGGTIEDSARHVPSVSRLFSRAVLGRRHPDYDASVPVQIVAWLAGMCLVFDRSTFERVGGFDERFHLYCEDVDICLRVHLAGKAVSWDQGSSVIHDARRRTTLDGRHFRWHVSSLLRLLTSSAYWRYKLYAVA